MDDRAKKLAIQLDDGRVVVGIPKPEDQGRLDQLDQETVLLTASGDYDTAGHRYSDEIELDVEGHAITLRLPTPADADALRKALAVGAVTATIVAAGAIAALQGSQAPAAPQPAAPPQVTEPRAIPAPQPRPDFLERKDQAIDPMLTQQGSMWDSQAGSRSSEGAPAAAPNQADGTTAGTHGPGRGELEGNP